MKSNCCNANVIVEGNVTKHYVCESCNEACDVVIESTLERHDTYGFIKKISRLVALNAVFSGKIKIVWTVPATSKRKGIYIKGKKV